MTDIKRDDHCFEVAVENKKYQAKTVILAVGTERRKLGLEREEELTGKGVHYCVVCDGPVYTGQKITIVGGGDAAVKGANLASEYAKKIFVIVRGDKLVAEPINLERMKKAENKIEVLFKTEVQEIVGDQMVEKLILTKEYNGSRELKVAGLFIEIGAEPRVELAKKLELELDDFGYIKVDNMMKTSLDGVFAAGDIVNLFGKFKQDVTAAAMGAVAATSAFEDNKDHGDKLIKI